MALRLPSKLLTQLAGNPDDLKYNEFQNKVTTNKEYVADMEKSRAESNKKVGEFFINAIPDLLTGAATVATGGLAAVPAAAAALAQSQIKGAIVTEGKKIAGGGKFLDNDFTGRGTLAEGAQRYQAFEEMKKQKLAEAVAERSGGGGGGAANLSGQMFPDQNVNSVYSNTNQRG